MKKTVWLILLVLSLLCGCLSGCKQSDSSSQTDSVNPDGTLVKMPTLPDFDNYEDGVPVITVFNTASQEYEDMNLESYVMGVVAGEMRNDWPMEALKAQAILARTFTLKFIAEKDSIYPYADISTDITEAQAYDADAVNDRVRQAVEETSGEIMSYQGTLPYAWFHAHSAGKTELASVGLDYESDPGYIQSVDSVESDLAPTAVKNWTATFSADEVAEAARQTGASIDSIESIELGEQSASGRTVYFLINGERVNAANLRVQLDSTKLKSTMLQDVTRTDDGKITFTGSGYGHGVGMSQWGAYQMATEGKTGEEIIDYYFHDIDIVNAWA